MISTVDPEMRHGRKSSSKRFDGYKGHVSVDTDSELVTEVTVTPANVYDAEAVEPLLDNEAAHHDISPQTVVGDQSVIDAERRRILAERDIEAVGKVPVRRPGGRYAKADFDIDLDPRAVTCPAGHTVDNGKTQRDKEGRASQRFTFPRKLCHDCPQREQCTTAQKTGRTITLNPQEALLQAALVKQKQEGFRDRYCYPRSAAEQVIGHLTQHGFRHVCYFGAAKTLLQAL